MKKKPLNIVVFRNNLRTIDNYPLSYASLENEKTLALYSYEILGNNFFQNEFIYQSIENLKTKLSKLNLNLCLTDNISKTLNTLNKNYELKIFYDEEVGVYEKEFEEKLKKWKVKSFFTQTMIEAFEFDYTKSFSHFRKKAEKKIIKDTIFYPKSFKTIDFESLNCKKSENKLILDGGEDEALKRVEFYLENYMHKYLDTRSLVSGENISTMFSPYLSIGCISPRYIYKKIKEHEEKTYESKSSYWIYFELLWRDFFHLVMKTSHNRLFLSSGLKNKKFNYKPKDKDFYDFFEAKSGVDLIDASIKELTTTGWLSNRNRQLVASFFIKNLGFNWLYLAKFFEKFLIDYNPASNYGNFAYQAFVGNDSSYRVFDIYKQSNQYMGKTYVKKWLKKEEKQTFNLNKMASLVKQSVYKEFQ